MATEIERKFLVRETSFLSGRQGERIVQGYVAKEPGAMTTRIRVRAERAYITLKGPRVGLARDEFEYLIPVEDALQMLSCYCAGRTVSKTRFLIDFSAQTFEVDVFEGRHAGLVIAEIELDTEEAQVSLPPWIGREVSDDPCYGNFALATAANPLRPSLWLPPPLNQALAHNQAL